MELRDTDGEPRVLISADALRHNARVVRRELGLATGLMAVVKADAYGHDAWLVAEALAGAVDDNGRPVVDAWAVATLPEAARLPTSAAGRPVLVLRPVENVYLGTERVRIQEAVRQGWTLTLCTPAAANDLGRIAMRMGRRLAVQVMLDTGMTRAGVDPSGLAEVVAAIAAWPSLRLTGMYSHFSSGEIEGSEATARQLALFTEATDEPARRMKLSRHLCNSGAVWACRAGHFDAVRPGVALYGLDPSGRPTVSRKLRPAMAWTAPVIGIRDVAAGTSVGYGETWRAPRRSRIALVGVGYADGYGRHLSGRGVVLINDRPCPVVGRVSMDMITIDVTDAAARIGDEVVLLDDDPLSCCSAYRHAEWGQTVVYEVTCAIGQRVPRVLIADESDDDQQARQPAGEDEAS